MVNRPLIAVLFCFCAACASIAPQAPVMQSGIITKSIVWKGTVIIEKDLCIPEGVEVVIEPGTRILVQKADISRTEPVFLLPETEILLKGRLIIKGTKLRPVTFLSYDAKKPESRDWAGIIVQGGTLQGTYFVIKHAYTAVTGLAGSIDISQFTFTGNNMGAVMFASFSGSMRTGRVTENKTGLVIDNSRMTISNIDVAKNEEGVIVRNAPPRMTGLRIYKNIYGIIMKDTDTEILTRDTTIYENTNNIVFAGSGAGLSEQ